VTTAQEQRHQFAGYRSPEFIPAEARLRGEQTRAVERLARTVEQRTRELRDTQRELDRALKEIHALKDRLQTVVGLRKQAGIARGGLAPWQLQRAKELMNATLAGHIPLRRLAGACGLSVSHFARAFRQSVGMPPHRWLLNRRIEHAQELLGNPQLSLADIALACGFSDQSHFTRMFAASMQISPGLWRRKKIAPAVPLDGAAGMRRSGELPGESGGRGEGQLLPDV
jgi:transcriptional regulator GlxA family with amidase domain